MQECKRVSNQGRTLRKRNNHPKKFALSNALKHTTCTCTIMATALQNSLFIPNMTPPQHIQNGPYEVLKFNIP